MRSSEAYQLAMHTQNQYRGTVIACQYIVPPEFAQLSALAALQRRFRHALEQVVLAQPHLQAGIVGENPATPAFVRLPVLDMHDNVEWITLHTNSYLQELYTAKLQAQLDAKFENISRTPGWRVVVLHKAGTESLEVLYVWNHVHHDCSSGKIFHQQLLRHLNETIDIEEPVVDAVDHCERWIVNLSDLTDKFPPNPELLTSWPMSPTFAVSELWRRLKPERFFPPGDVHAHWAPIQATPYKTRMRNFIFDDDDVTRILSACRQNHTTVTGLVHALCLVSLSTALQDARGFASRTPYDLRQILPSNTKSYPWLDPKETMCNYISVIDHEFSAKLVDTIRSYIPPSSSSSDAPPPAVMPTIWSVAARVRQEIQSRLDAGTKNNPIAIVKSCPDWNVQQQREMHGTRYLSWQVTNLGVLDGQSSASELDKTEAWSIRRAGLVQSAGTAAAALSVSVMTLKGGEMCVACTWQDAAVGVEIGERLVGELERWLMGIGA